MIKKTKIHFALNTFHCYAGNLELSAKTLKIIIPDELHKDKRHLKHIQQEITQPADVSTHYASALLKPECSEKLK